MADQDGTSRASELRIRALEAEGVDAATGGELEDLRNFVATLMEEDAQGKREGDEPFRETPEGDAVSRILAEWHAAVLDSLPQFGLQDEEEAAERAYEEFRLEQTSGSRTYRTLARIDTRFSDIARVRRTTDLMLRRVTEGRFRCFVSNARRYGLSAAWRRSRSLPFPHPLPYLSPPPATAEGRYAEEAGVIEAALRFAFSRPTPGVQLTIDYADWPPNGNFWTLGSAIVNLYNGRRYLRITLNDRAYPRFSDDVWAGTIAHEILHNLGWGHPVGGYVGSVAIVNYDWCIRGSTARLEEGMNEQHLIR
jgi:hypothetical protein